MPGAPNAATPEPTPYTLFLGADLEIHQNQEFRRVQGVEGENLIIFVDGKMTSIPTTKGPVDLRVDRSLKLASYVVTIGDLKGERTYTPANDPVRKFQREQPGSTGANQYDLAQGRATQYAMTSLLGDQNSPIMKRYWPRRDPPRMRPSRPWTR